MSLKHGILGLLSYNEFSGYELNKIFSESLAFFWPAQISQIYRELTTLEKSGWVESRTVVQKDHPNKKLFRLTDDGRNELTRWLRTPKADEPLSTKFPILLKLFFSSDLEPDFNITDLQHLRRKFEAELYKLKMSDIAGEFNSKTDSSPERVLCWESAQLFGESFYQMCIKWIDDVIEKIQTNAANSG